MAEMNPFTANPNASRWVVTNPTPGVIRHSVRSEKRSQLLKEAASLVPSQQDLIDRLTKHKLSPGDQNFFQTVLGGQVNDYLTKYTENPYFAFSREGKEKVKTMQSIVNNPLLGEAALSFDKSLKTAETAANDRNDQSLNVVGGMIPVYDKDTGRIKTVLPDHLKPSMMPLTFASEMNEKVRKGFFNPETGRVEEPVKYNRLAFKDVIAGINAIVGTPGTTEHNKFSQDIEAFNKDLNSRLQVTYKNNASQIDSKLKSIFGKYGMNLPDNYMDTLLATEYTNQYSRTGTIDRVEAYKNVAKMIEDIVNGERVQSTIVGESPLSKIANDRETQARAQMSESGPLSSIVLGQGVVTTKRDLRSKNGKVYSDVVTREYPSMIFEKYEVDGVSEGILPLNVNGVYKHVLKAPGATLKTADGKAVINESFAIPAPDPNIIVYTDPGDGKEYLEMDILAHGEAGDLDENEYARPLKDNEEIYWERIENYAKEVYEKNPQYGTFEGESRWLRNDDYYRVRAKVEYNPDASTPARYLSGDKFSIDKRAVTIGAGGGEQSSTINTIPFKN